MVFLCTRYLTALMLSYLLAATILLIFIALRTALSGFFSSQ
jgi:VIT1/CCC1 family predicted Fe2+/Mn2+ transporter